MIDRKRLTNVVSFCRRWSNCQSGRNRWRCGQKWQLLEEALPLSNGVAVFGAQQCQRGQFRRIVIRVPQTALDLLNVLALNRQVFLRNPSGALNLWSAVGPGHFHLAGCSLFLGTDLINGLSCVLKYLGVALVRRRLEEL